MLSKGQGQRLVVPDQDLVQEAFELVEHVEAELDVRVQGSGIVEAREVGLRSRGSTGQDDGVLLHEALHRHRHVDERAKEVLDLNAALARQAFLEAVIAQAQVPVEGAAHQDATRCLLAPQYPLQDNFHVVHVPHRLLLLQADQLRLGRWVCSPIAHTGILTQRGSTEVPEVIEEAPGGVGEATPSALHLVKAFQRLAATAAAEETC
mmetsp:Transcript_117499/g.262613  ORF Transcript_117499/g.262613 Transcript_117499/m.262613 type:complete len:207 (+) Transcript_117499:386-1006(+)